MLLSKRTSIKVSREYANLIGHMCYAASKLWNVCNYERQHYKETGMAQYPDWYYQKKAHKEDLWYKQLPSQTAQEVCRLLALIPDALPAVTSPSSLPDQQRSLEVIWRKRVYRLTFRQRQLRRRGTQY